MNTALDRDSPSQAAWRNYQRTVDRYGHGHYRTEYSLLLYGEAIRKTLAVEKERVKRLLSRRGRAKRG